MNTKIYSLPLNIISHNEKSRWLIFIFSLCFLPSAIGQITVDCPNPIIVNGFLGLGGFLHQPTWSPPTATTECPVSGAVSIMRTTPLPNPFFINQTFPVSYLITDNCGNQAICNTVFKPEPFPFSPNLAIFCPEDILVEIPQDESGATVNWDPNDIDVIFIPTGCDYINGSQFARQIEGPNNGSLFPIGITTIEYEVAPYCINSGSSGSVSCSFNIIVSNDSGTECPANISNYISLGEFNDSKYFLSNQTSTWQAAQTTVANIPDGYLLSISDQAENDFIFNQLTDAKVFIGLNDAATEGNFIWESNEIFNYSNFEGNNSAQDDYAAMNFWNGQWNLQSNQVWLQHILEVPCEVAPPCDYDSQQWYQDLLTSANSCDGCISLITEITYQNETYIAVSRSDALNPSCALEAYNAFRCDGTLVCAGLFITECGPILNNGTVNEILWKVEDYCCICSDVYEPVCGSNGVTYSNFCEAECAGITSYTPGECPIIECPPLITGVTYLGEFNNHHYYLSESNHNWNNAQAINTNTPGYLASINSAEENEFLRSKLSTLQVMAFIGISDQVNEGNFYWDSNELVDYTNFETSNTEEGDYGVMQFWDGQWLLDNVWVERPYVLEYPCEGSPSCIASQQEWVINTVNSLSDCIFNECIRAVNVYEYQGEQYVGIDYSLCLDSGISISTCEGESFCQLGGLYPPDILCSQDFTNSAVLIEQLWTEESCNNCDIENQQWVNDLIDNINCTNDCIGEVAIYEYNGAEYLMVNQNAPSCADGQRIVYTCQGEQFCVDGGIIGSTECAFFFNNAVKQQTLWSYENNCNNCPTNLSGYTLLGQYNGSLYYRSNQLSTWPEANIIATTTNGHLAIVNNAAENDFIQSKLEESSFIGFSDQQNEGNPNWVDGSTITYTNYGVCCSPNSNMNDFGSMNFWDGTWTFENDQVYRHHVLEVPCITTFLVLEGIPNPETTEEVEPIIKTRLYPNPVENELFLNIESAQEIQTTLSLYNVIGQVHFTKPLSLDIGLNTISLNVSELTSGAYFIHLKDGKGKNKALRFIKQRD